ncbi:Serine/threonine-protein phosphatase 1 [Methyloligella halotolerans]|uniref:Serine/threonine-protein phosphatase 1 n=1 Tax=Methyloligella halotolerans TaxID=1177755 RepID=A0A1E2S160_9HYPH|nr:metallophosphoesterase family protein [Methyloligella halotolerans]ODA68243.1 Serine/threonine-protein phosphatase 1 [Methyloligella halotolerans]
MSDMKLPEDNRIYAIGDVHGCLDLLDPLLETIAEDIAAHPNQRAELIFLGDLIDRGPDSKAVIDRVISSSLPAPASFLMGNHEEMLLKFLEKPAEGLQWAMNGGEETLRSYGIAPEDLPRHPEAARDRLLKAMPAAHLDFYRDLQLFAARGDYFFCHAGVRPGVPLDRQDRFDLLWIREPFLGTDEDFGKVVVHGHTPVRAVADLPNRIGIDTGGFIWGRLSAVVLSGNERTFLESRR